MAPVTSRPDTRKRHGCTNQEAGKMFRAVFVFALAALVLAASATAASSSLRVIGSSRSSGDFAVTAASGSKNGAHALYMRGYGRGLSGNGVVACSRGIASVGSKST